MAYMREYLPPVSYPWFEGPSTVVVLVFLQLLKLKMQIREECTNSLETSSDRIWNENVSLRQIKKKIEYSKKP